MGFIAWTLHLLFPAYTAHPRWVRISRAISLVALIVILAPAFTVPVQALGLNPGFLHNIHLVFHEAGHVITGVVSANRTLVVFMGSGFQVLFPLVLVSAFYFKNRDAFGAAICLVWAGHATLDVAPYIADARALELPLLGGGTGSEIEGHDWEYLLAHWGALAHDTQIAAQVAMAGRIVMILAFMWATLALIYEQFLLAQQDQDVGEPKLEEHGPAQRPPW